MNNPFRAALTALNVSLGELDYIGEDTDGVKESLAQIQAAIRLLEAAEKVDKHIVKEGWLSFEHCIRPARYSDETMRSQMLAVQALLDALPDKEAK